MEPRIKVQEDINDEIPLHHQLAGVEEGHTPKVELKPKLHWHGHCDVQHEHQADQVPGQAPAAVGVEDGDQRDVEGWGCQGVGERLPLLLAHHFQRGHKLLHIVPVNIQYGGQKPRTSPLGQAHGVAELLLYGRGRVRPCRRPSGVQHVVAELQREVRNLQHHLIPVGLHSILLLRHNQRRPPALAIPGAGLEDAARHPVLPGKRRPATLGPGGTGRPLQLSNEVQG
mmetsp:Transcript_8774/g.22081  ORF Transcript_8774/g.22081 Transcript_8774/m.22081 type:complete len:227 (-) Transcript_8774:268-948(-)